MLTVPSAAGWSTGDCAASGERRAKPISHAAPNLTLLKKSRMPNPKFISTTLKIGAKSGGAHRMVKDVAFAGGGVCATDARKSARLKPFPLSGTSSGGKFGHQTWGVRC